MDLLSLLRTLGGLAVVLGLLAGALWLVRRYDLRLPGRAIGARDRRLELLETLPIDGRRMVALLRRDGREHLVLIAPEGHLILESGVVPDAVDHAATQARREARDLASALRDQRHADVQTMASDSFAMLVDRVRAGAAPIASALKAGTGIARLPRKPWIATLCLVGFALAATIPSAAFAQSATVSMGSGSVSGRAITLVMMLTVLSLAPGILMTVTSFTRIVVALSLLRTGIGAQGVPPNPVIISLALFLSFFVMAPTFQVAWDQGVSPYSAGKLTEQQAFVKTAEPFRQFMLKHVRGDDLKLFVDLSRKAPVARADVPLTTLMPAFMISELRRAFEIGFLLLLPFLIIDLAVSAVLMAMGMMMLPPPTIALPMKIIFFVLVDGWALVAGSLIRSFGGSG